MTDLPAPETLLAAVRESCAACTTRSNISINADAIDRFILGIKEQDWTPSDHGIRLPLAFESVDDELNVIGVLGLLNFLSGYRSALHRLTGRGAYNTILSLVLASYLSASPDASILTAHGMVQVTAGQLADLARIRTHTERKHESLPVTVGVKDEEAFEVLELLVGVLRETGAILQAAGDATFGIWLRRTFEKADGRAGAVVHALASTFPAFRDVHVVDAEPVYLLKKALWLTTVVSLRFTDDEEAPFKVPSLDQMPIFADNVLPTLLIHHGILPLSSASDPLLASLSLSSPDTVCLSATSATRLRAAAVTACVSIVARAHQLSSGDGQGWLAKWSEQQLDGWMWEMGKSKELRPIQRVAEQETVFY